MSYVRIWIHAVFSIKDRDLQTLNKEKRDVLISHIRTQCSKKKIYLDAINGYNEHLHLLISLGKQQNISEIMQSIKGESSFWANQQQLFEHKLVWQDDYFAVSVSESQVEKVKNYIYSQETHHSEKSFEKETDEFMQLFGWNKPIPNQINRQINLTAIGTKVPLKGLQ
ncbi:MAG: IS200/IS605 family transposase [Prevotellaceae bacterium]|jgi:putative transposase|nr:IS200/IS605 family transposase [Prevotellaceae bacterium]